MTYREMNDAPTDGTKVDLWVRNANGNEYRITDCWWGGGLDLLDLREKIGWTHEQKLAMPSIQNLPVSVIGKVLFWAEIPPQPEPNSGE